MSGCSGDIDCPNCCSDTCKLYSESKPYEYSIIQCGNCGLTIEPKVEYLDLDELNYIREDLDLDKLTKLPPQNKDI